MTETKSQITEALLNAQLEFPPVEKKRTAKGERFSYQYADINDVIALTRKPLANYGLCISQGMEISDQGAQMLVTLLMHTSGESMRSTMLLPITGREPQKDGSLITYYRRYALSALLGISTEADDDGAAATHSNGISPHDEAPVESMMNKTAMKSALMEFDKQLSGIKPDEPHARSQLENLKMNFAEVLEQAPKVMPTWWNSPKNSDKIGIHDRILNKENEITDNEMRAV